MNLKMKVFGGLAAIFMGFASVFNVGAIETELHLAVKRGDFEAVKALCETMPRSWVYERDASRFTPVYYATQNGNLDMVDCLINHGADANSFLSVAAREGNIRLVKYLVKHYKVDLDAGLFGAVANGHPNVIEHLVNVGANATVGLSNATLLANMDMVRYFVEGRGVNPEFGLFNAASNGSLEIVRYLVEHGANVNARDRDAKAALHYAYNSQTVKYLVEHGANVNSRDSYGRTPLVILRSRLKVAEMCLPRIGDLIDDLKEVINYLTSKGAKE